MCWYLRTGYNRRVLHAVGGDGGDRKKNGKVCLTPISDKGINTVFFGQSALISIFFDHRKAINRAVSNVRFIEKLFNGFTGVRGSEK